MNRAMPKSTMTSIRMLTHIFTTLGFLPHSGSGARCTTRKHGNMFRSSASSTWTCEKGRAKLAARKRRRTYHHTHTHTQKWMSCVWVVWFRMYFSWRAGSSPILPYLRTKGDVGYLFRDVLDLSGHQRRDRGDAVLKNICLINLASEMDTLLCISSHIMMGEWLTWTFHASIHKTYVKLHCALKMKHNSRGSHP